jgi:hypothetical protein
MNAYTRKRSGVVGSIRIQAIIRHDSEEIKAALYKVGIGEKAEIRVGTTVLIYSSQVRRITRFR